MNKIMVTGAFGFIGSYLTKYLLKNYEDVTVLALGRNTSQKNLRRLDDCLNHPRLKIAFVDFAKENMTEYFDGIDYCIHAGAKTFVDYSIRDPEPFIESNVIGTYNMLEGARKSKTLKKYIQVSTDEVYGPCTGEPFKENSTILPSNPYSSSKSSADSLAYSYFITYGLPVVISRTENNYGPFQGVEKVMPTFIKKILDGEPLTIYGDGTHRRRWLHVEDHCRGLLHLLGKGKVGEIYHIAGEQEITNNELAERILAIMDKPWNVTYIPDHDARPGHDKRYALDVTKLKSLGWTPEYDINKGFKETVKWYLGNQWWLSV